MKKPLQSMHAAIAALGIVAVAAGPVFGRAPRGRAAILLRTASVAALLLLARGTPVSGHSRIELRASPVMGIAPMQVVLTAMVEDVSEAEELYCPSVEWDWGDGTISRSSPDCEPFDPDRARVRRFYSKEHLYHFEGHFVTALRLFRGDEVVASGETVVRVLP